MRITDMSAAILGLTGFKYTVSAFTPSINRGALSVRQASKPFVLNNSKKLVASSLRYHSSSNKDIFELLASLDDEVDPGKVEGTDLTVLKYPNPSLRAENAEITQEELDDGSIAKIAKEMLLVMYAADGVGLAAPQVGINKRLIVYNESGDSKKWLNEIIMVNPKIVEFSNAKDVENEGCLSFPDMRGNVERPKWVKVEAISLKGRKIKKKFKGWESRIFQHEYDHLDGVVYIDRLSEEGRAEVQPKLDALAENFGEGGAL